MAKQRKQRQQPSKKKVQVKQKIAKQDSTNTIPLKKFTDVKLPEDSKHITVYGLNNLGNTCFYNSALQVLVSVPMLKDFCLELSSSHHLRLGPIGLALRELVQTVYGQSELSQAQSAKVSKLLQREGNPVFSPSRLLAAICKVAPQFKGGQQQDSHELLGKLIEGMLAEEVRAAKALQEQEGGSGEPDMAAAPMTEALFGGVLSSQVICDDCGHKAVTLEPFYNLSLPIPPKLRADPGEQATTKRRMKRIAKKEKGGDGKPPMELPNSSMPAQEQAKLGSKQDKKKEKEEKKAGKPARRRAQKQAAAAQAGTEDAEAAGEGSREPFPSLADSNEGSESSKLQEPTAEGSVAPGGQPKGQLLGGRVDSDSDSDHSSVTSPGPGLAGVDMDLADSAGIQMAYPQAHPAPLTATSLSEDTEVPQGGGHLASGVPLGQPEYVSPAEGTLAGSMPGNYLQSDTCVSRDADTLTMNAGEQTECPQRTQAAAMQARQSLMASGLALGLTSEQPSTHLQETGRQQHRSTGQMTDLSAQMHAASLAPDAKSAAAPSGAAHSHGSSEDEGESCPPGSQSTSDRRRSTDSTRSMDCRMLPCSSSNVALIREGSGETSPPLGWQPGCPQPGCGQPAMRLLGGGADTWEGDMLHANGSGGWAHLGHDAQQKGSSGSSSQPTLGKTVLDASTQQRAAADATDAAAGVDLDSANGRAQRDAFSVAESAQPGAEVAGEGLGTRQDEGQDLVRATSLGSISGASSVTNADVALYDSLEALRGEPSTMNDLSSESEEDAVVAAGRLKLCEFPVEGTAERGGKAGPAQPEEEEEGHLEDAQEEEGLKEDASEEMDEALPHEESAAASSEAEEPQKEVTLEGCLTAFFAKEDVTWACPAEGKLLSRAQSSGEPGQELASPSTDVATPEAREKLKRRSVSFSEEAPRVKFIPGSAEQRGTNFVLALSGERPFCRPLKHGGAYFLLTAEVDGERKDAIFLGLQGQDESDETRHTLESCNAIGGAIEFTSVSIDPIKDPADEEEQAKVMSQAQALLDCVADLIVHCGVLSTVDILQEGVQLSRRSSLDCPADSWRISGHAPSPDGAAPWEYPPATAEAGTSPRPKGDEVYVPREPIGRHSPSNTDAESPLTTLKSRLGAFDQPIPEDGSGSSASASLSLGSTTAEAAHQLRNDLPKGLACQAEQTEGPDGLELGAERDARMAGGTKQPSALSAALSEGAGACSLQQGQGEQAASGWHHLSAAPNKGAPGGTHDAAAGTQPEEHVHSAPRSIPGSGRHLGRPRQLRAGHSAGLSASPAGVNSSTGTAMFWTGSQALGIAFADDEEAQDSEPEAAERVQEEGHEMAHSPLQAKAKAFGVSFEDSGSGGASSQGDDSVHAGANGPVVKGARDDSSNAAEPSAREALEERAAEDARQQSISDVAAAAIAEVDAEQAEQEGDEQRQEQHHAQAAVSLSGELPPGETLSERGSVDEEREGLSVSPDLRHLKSVPELAKASPEASRPDAPLSSSPITLSPLHGPRRDEAPEASPAADRTPVPSRQGSSRINSMERMTRSILRNKVAGPMKRRAVKGYIVHRAPEALMLHLKRFQQDLSGRLRKINGPMPFPRELDLSPFCDPEGEDAKGARYSLVGVVEHQGSMAGGHYISYSARLPDGQPAQPASSSEPASETPARANGPTKAATPKIAGMSKGAQQNGPVPNGKAKSGSEVAKQGGGGDKGMASSADEGLKRAAKELRASLAASRKSFDAEKMLWFRASDSHVKLVSWEQVAACEPYLLMYVRTK